SERLGAHEPDAGPVGRIGLPADIAGAAGGLLEGPLDGAGAVVVGRLVDAPIDEAREAVIAGRRRGWGRRIATAAKAATAAAIARDIGFPLGVDGGVDGVSHGREGDRACEGEDREGNPEGSS